MNSVKVNRVDLLDKIRANRANHHVLFVRAQDGYRTAVIHALDTALSEAREGTAFRTYVELVAPEDHTADYDTVISMLEMSVDTEIVVDQQEFSKYVMDKWDWSAHANFLNTTYASGGTVAPRDVYGKRGGF